MKSNNQKFNVGDKVRIKIGLYPNVYYDGVRFAPNMISYEGRVGNVLNINEKGCRLDIDAREWNWSDGMLELVESCTYTGIELLQAIKDGEFKDGDEFTVRGGNFIVDTVTLKKDIHRTELIGKRVDANLSMSQILNHSFTPIKKEVINIAKENKHYSKEFLINVFDEDVLLKFNIDIKDNTVKATLPSGISGVAKCCPEDKFDEYKGVRIASLRAIKTQLTSDIDSLIRPLCRQ